MKRLALITCAAALGVCSTASVANAAAPEVSKKNCEAQAGTLSNDRGTKTCITVGAPYTVGEHQSYPGIGGPDWPKVYYSGHWHDEYTDQDITTQSQKGNGDVTTTTTTQLLSTRVVPDDCFYTFYGLTVDKPTAECAYFGVYPLS